MRRVLVFTPDLIFYSQVKGLVERGGWTPVHLREPKLPADGVDGDCLVVDATRDLPKAWAVLEAAKPACPWLVLVAHPHTSPEVAEEALHRGATEAVRRGALLSRLAQRLEIAGSPTLFVGAAPDEPSEPRGKP